VAVDRLLDAPNFSVALNTLGKDASALGRKEEIDNKKAPAISGRGCFYDIST